MSQSAPLEHGHIGLSVTDLGRSIAFYQDVLDLELIQRSDEIGRAFAFLGTGGRLLLTLWQQSARGFELTNAGLHHLAFQVPTFEALRAAESRVRARGLTPTYEGVVPHMEGADSAALYFTDPDGIRLEICTPTGAAGLVAPVVGAPSCGFF
jgi:lactoylglutathione lyase